MYTRKAVRSLLKDIEAKKVSVHQAVDRLKDLPYESMRFAKIDHHRSFRKGYPEAIYAPGKTIEQLRRIVNRIKKSGQPLILTRLEKKIWFELSKSEPTLNYNDDARIAFFPNKKKSKSKTKIAIVTGGTSDIPVAEEAAITLELLGKKVDRLYDCGVAGFHRFVDVLPKIKKCDSVICVAGMEGALPSVVAGLIERPVIAVPTSVGYGANFKGLSALLTMLNSCAQGIAVVNIDNGYGAACFAASVSK